MRFIQALAGLLHILTIWRCLGIAGSLINEMREGANGIRVALLVLFAGLISRSTWSVVTILAYGLSPRLLGWHIINSLATWFSLVLLEKELTDGDSTPR